MASMAVYLYQLPDNPSIHWLLQEDRTEDHGWSLHLIGPPQTSADAFSIHASPEAAAKAVGSYGTGNADWDEEALRRAYTTIDYNTNGTDRLENWRTSPA